MFKTKGGEQWINQWTRMGNDGQQWVTMGKNGQQWDNNGATMDSNGQE